MLKEAHAEKSRLMESRVSGVTGAAAGRGVSPQSPGLSACVCRQEREMELRRQALEDERRRREQLERRLQDETTRRQKLVEKEVKLREKHFSQVQGRQCGVPSLSLASEADPAPRHCPGVPSGKRGSSQQRWILQGSVALPGSSPDAVPPHPQGGF